MAKKCKFLGYPRKLRLKEVPDLPHHRSGWKYALESLEPLYREDGLLFDSHVELQFAPLAGDPLTRPVAAYREPWVGVIHNPPNIPRWLHYRRSPSQFFRRKAWRESMRVCRGLIVLSPWMAGWVRERTDVPVLSLVHPTEIPETLFSLEQFEANPEPLLLQVGWWLRWLTSIREVPLRRLKPAILIPIKSARLSRLYPLVLDREREIRKAPPMEEWGVRIIPHQSNLAYDELLSRNIVFVHLVAAVANNTLIECIVRHTPVLVNALPSVVDYLGADYPLYYRSLEEAGKMAEDIVRIREAHQYLKALPKTVFTGDYFCQSLAESEMYRQL